MDKNIFYRIAYLVITGILFIIFRQLFEQGWLVNLAFVAFFLGLSVFLLEWGVDVVQGVKKQREDKG